LVGRDEELRAIVAAIDDPACGGMALVGAPGVGKTRLAEEAMAVIDSRGLATVQVRASRSESGIPFAAFEPLIAELGITEAGASGRTEAVLRSLGQGGRADRVVLAVDDTQDLDDLSAGLLDRLAGREEIFILLTVRAGAAPDRLHAMSIDGTLRRLQLEPLEADEIATLVTRALGGEVEAATIGELVRASAGNVMFLRELVTGAVELGALTRQGHLWSLSGSAVATSRLRDLIGYRFGRLTDKELEAVQLVALSEPVDMALLGSLVPLGVVEELEERQILEFVRSGDGVEVRVGHPLYGEVVRNRLPRLRLARLCRSLAAATAEHAKGRELSPHETIRVAVWHLDGGEGRADLSLIAARQALQAEDFRLAARLARHAWDVERDVEAAMILFTSSTDSHEIRDMEPILREALSRAERDSQRADLATSLAVAIFVWADRTDEALELLVQTREELTDESSRRQVEARRAELLLYQGPVEPAIEIDRGLLEGPPDAAWVHASVSLAVALTLAGRAEEGIRHSRAAFALYESLESLHFDWRASFFGSVAAFAVREAGYVEEARIAVERAYAAAVERRNRGAIAWFGSVLGLTFVDQGNLVEARRLFRESAIMFNEFHHPGERWSLAGVALAASYGGDAAEARAALDELEALDRVMPSSIRFMDVNIERGRAWTAVAEGDLARARRLLSEAADLARNWGQLSVAAACLHDLLRIGEGGEVARALLALDESVEGPMMSARVAHAEAVVSSDPAPAETAAAKFEECGAFLPAAEVALLGERLHRRRGTRPDAAAQARLSGLVARVDGARTPGLEENVGLDKLSSRERDVALLAASGLSSKDIAAKLHISARTVDNHLQHIYLKLGFAGRADLARHLGGDDPVAL
jgi:DNA-binding CsgD family transcriptional regulator/tetratricopeptide (TPR) repeat protein